ncbi:MAG: DUF362 domain-containing protein, partial [Promethearchaeota archaeon]
MKNNNDNNPLVVLVVSDIHLGAYRTKHEAFKEFLEEINKKKKDRTLKDLQALIITGDCFDLCVESYRNLCNKVIFLEIYNQFIKLQELNVEIIITLGNHDVVVTGNYDKMFESRKMDFINNMVKQFENREKYQDLFKRIYFCQYCILHVQEQGYLQISCYDSKEQFAHEGISNHNITFQISSNMDPKSNYLFTHGHQFDSSLRLFFGSRIWKHAIKSNESCKEFIDVHYNENYKGKLGDFINEIKELFKKPEIRKKIKSMGKRKNVQNDILIQLYVIDKINEKREVLKADNSRNYKKIARMMRKKKFSHITHVVFGHTHKASVPYKEGGTCVANAGAWQHVDLPSYAGIFLDGSIKVSTTKEEGTISQKPGFKFRETMKGYYTRDLTDYKKGYVKGEKLKNEIQINVTIDIDDMEDFIKLSGRKANLIGTVSCADLGNDLEILKGEFNLFQPSEITGERRMTYEFFFTGSDGNEYFFEGYKVIYDDPGKIDLFEDMTTLFTRIYRKSDEELRSFGSGILRYSLADIPSMLFSMQVTNTSNLLDKIKTNLQFFSFLYGELRDTYYHDLSPFYYTAYENLVLSGELSNDGTNNQFFFFSGIHDKDFPWGDKTAFWDIALLIKVDNEKYRRFAISKHRIENLFLDVEKGLFRYEGEIFEICEGNSISFSQMRDPQLPEHLKRQLVEIEINFETRSFPTIHLPFNLASNYKDNIDTSFKEDIIKWQDHLQLLGLHLIPHKVIVREGTVTLKDEESKSKFHIVKENTTGEAEVSSFQNIKWPSLYYNYFCRIDPNSSELRLHIRTDVLKEDRRDFLVNKIEGQLGKIVNQIAWLDAEVKDDQLQVLSREEGDKFSYPEKVLLEINNDHYPTAVFQRRMVSFGNNTSKEKTIMALEENTDALNLSSINSDQTSIVAVAKNHDKYEALDQVIDASGFFNILENDCQKSGKDKADFSIIIKSNFMFMYSLKDRTTFTDPELVEHLVNRIWERGYRNIAVAEARSTFGTYVTNREVRTVANYIGLECFDKDVEKYDIIDLSLDTEEYQFEGLLGKHSVNEDWKNADFRISFAKNKTHAYAFYTLNLKNIYGALPMENKYKEYHCERDIFSTTIEYIKCFPIHFGFIDAFVSADGPFGVFADKNPNVTETIIGGENLIAVDWIGAAK